MEQWIIDCVVQHEGLQPTVVVVVFIWERINLVHVGLIGLHANEDINSLMVGHPLVKMTHIQL